MSSRQRNRLKNKDIDFGGKDSQNEEEIRPPFVSKKTSDFQMMQMMQSLEDSDSDSESPSSTEDEDPLTPEAIKEENEQEALVSQKSTQNTKKQVREPSQKTAVKEEEGSKEIDFELLGIENSANGCGSNSHFCNQQKIALLWPDPRHLNQENEVKRKFGSAVITEEEEETTQGNTARRRRGKGRMAKPAQVHHRRRRKCLLGQGKPDWPPPISAVAGGFSMQVDSTTPSYYSSKKLDAEIHAWNQGALWYSFTWSEAYRKLQTEFEANVAATADPQRLSLFCAEHYYHTESLLQIAMAMAHTGQMDYAADFLQKCLFYFECAYLESFRPAESSCRMNFCAKENRIFFSALFRHMQMTGMMGCPRTAFEVGKFLLSLDPVGDPLGVLLCLDYYLLASGEYEMVVRFAESKLPIGFHPEALVADEIKSEHKTCFAPLHACISDLLNWTWAKAFALFRLDRSEEARQEMIKALNLFPCVLPPLVDAVADGKHNWGPVLAHFRAAAFGVPGELALHLAAIYLQRSSDLWNWDLALDFLYECALFVAGYGGRLDQELPVLKSDVERLLQLYSFDSPVHKYRQTMVTDFKDEFERLPGDANMLNPALLAPRMARVHRRQLNAQAEEQFLLQQAMMENLDINAIQGNLTPDMPLMQLFLQSLLPWNSFDPSGRTNNDDRLNRNQLNEVERQG